jgi:hypothetical protein
VARRLPLAGCIGAIAALLLPGGASGAVSKPRNWATQNEAVVCGVAIAVEGTAFDPGAGAERDGLWPGLQCQTTGLPLSQAGDPAVALGQGRTGRAQLVYISQDNLVSQQRYGVLPAGTVWTADGISCTLAAESVSCVNTAGYGFTLSPGSFHPFAPRTAPAPTRCAGVSYTFPHTDDHGHVALNNLTAAGVSCATARSVARTFIITGRPPRHWHAAMKQVSAHIGREHVTVGEEILTRGNARVTGDIAG